MNCPWCDFDGTVRGLHAHLGAQHPDVVQTTERKGNHFYEVTCPVCGDRYEHSLRKGKRDPSFLEEFDHEIRMVALDMLVHHLMAEHESTENRSPSGGTGQEL